MPKGERRIIKGLPTRRVVVTLDIVAAAAVDAMAARDDVSFSRALSALATAAAVTDPELLAAIKETLQGVVLKRVAKRGWHPGLSAALAQEIVTGEDAEKLGWN